MRVLFVSRGNSKEQISPMIRNQGDSLSRIGIDIEYFTIKGKGISAYWNSIFILRRRIRRSNYDIVHAHYSLSGIIATFSQARPLVVSLMGSDIFEIKMLRVITMFFSKNLWNKTIVKSEEMKRALGNNLSYVIPNGVNFDRFTPKEESEISNFITVPELPRILFIGDPSRTEKNYKLAKAAIDLLPAGEFEFKAIYNIENSLIPYYMNSSKALLLTSLWEGSPNVIKEAMACNICIVSVDVGDVKLIIGNTKGCFITSYEPEMIASKLTEAIAFKGRTTGRRDIEHLDEEIISKNILELYHKTHCLK